MFKSYNQAENISKKDLLENKDFFLDVTQFLKERNGVKEMLSPEEAYEQFMEHMRYHNVNEVTVLRDLEYAQNSNNEGNYVNRHEKYRAISNTIKNVVRI